MPKFARMLLSALALLACTAHAQSAPSYHAVKFDAQFRPQILNDLGQVAGMDQDGRPAIWNPDGSILKLPGAASEVTITGFNNQGTVVGNALLPGYSLPQPVAWRNGGSVERLPFDGLGGYTTGINNRGDIIGHMAGASNTGSGQVGFIQWGDGSAAQLFDEYKPEMINDRGLVLGQRSDAWGLRRWQDGVFGDTLYNDLHISGLNNEGRMSGSHDAMHAFSMVERDGLRELQDLWSGSASDLNDAGSVVGFTEWSNHAMLWFDGRAYVLDHLWHDVRYSEWSLLNAWDINASGAILANGFGPADAAFLLSPVPEPGAVMLLLAGLMLLALHRLLQRRLLSRMLSTSLLALLACSTYAQEAPTYRALRFDGTFAPKFLNDAGQVAGIGQDGKAVIWSPGGSVVRLSGVINDLSITGFNSQGTVIGNGIIPGFAKPQAVMWRNGGAMELVQSAGSGGVAAGINNRGDIVGYNYDARATGTGSVGFIQWADGRAPHRFDDYVPTIINDVGMVLGSRTDEFGFRSWRDGVFGNDHTPYDFYASALNNEGRRAGYQDHGYAHTLLVNGTERDFRQLWSRYAFDINDAGSVVGETAYERAMLLYQDRQYVLDHLWNEEQYAGWFLERAWDINASGQILVNGGNEWDQYATFLLSPAPEPAQGVLLLAGLALLGSLRFRPGRRSA
ncbi:hypothetical protein [Pseudoduganella sp. HUAS MS19]